MGTTVSWSGGTSNLWSAKLNWTQLIVPSATNDVAIGAGGTVTVDVAAAANNVTLGTGAPSNGNLDVAASLALGGTLSGGAVILSGTISGGTLENTYFAPDGGTLLGVALVGTVAESITGRLAIDTLTAASLTAPVAVTGTLSLGGGSYDALGVTLDAASNSVALLSAGTGEVTLGAHATVALSDAGLGAGQAGAPPAVGGLALGGALLNQGSIGGAVLGLMLDGSGFANDGTIALAAVLATETTTARPGGGPNLYTEWFGPTVEATAATFDNAGQVTLAGGTLAATGAVFVNSGVIALSDTVGTATLPTAVTIGGPNSSIDNTGTISADLIEFAGPVALGALGTLQGGLWFDSTLDLQGGTLDASAYPSVVIGGLVENGTIKVGSGSVLLQGATLGDVVFAGSVTVSGTLALQGVPAGAAAVVLDGTTTELVLTPAMTVSGATITADGPAANTLSLTGGTATLAASAALVANGPLLDLLGPGTLEDDGTILVAAGSLAAKAAIDGAGTITLAAGATLGESAALDGSLVVSLGSGAVLGAATLGGSVDVTVGAGATLDIGTLTDSAVVTLEAKARLTINALAGAPTIDYAGVALVTLPGTGALPVTLLNVAGGDLIDFASVSSTFSGLFGHPGATTANGALDVTGASGDQAQVPMNTTAPFLTFGVTNDSSGGTLVTAAACYRVGTRIATSRGAVPIERLRRGDRVRTASGRLVPVRWLGRRRVDCRRLARPADGWPVRIAAHAIGAGVPSGDLFVSPDHALYLDGVLIPARYLLNGATIRQIPVARVEYWHLELPAHDVVLAEGVAAESYLDTGNRAAFEGERPRRALTPAAALLLWRRRACAKLLTEGPRLAAIHARLLARAQMLGHALTAAPALRVVRGQGGAVALISRRCIPAQLDGPGGDARALGVAVAAIRLDGQAVKLDDPRLVAGWHPPEDGWRWTDGAAVIAAGAAREIAIEVAITGRYWEAA